MPTYTIFLDGKPVGVIEPPENEIRAALKRLGQYRPITKPLDYGKHWKIMLAIMLLEAFVIGTVFGYIWRMIQELI